MVTILSKEDFIKKYDTVQSDIALSKEVSREQILEYTKLVSAIYFAFLKIKVGDAIEEKEEKLVEKVFNYGIIIQSRLEGGDKHGSRYLAMYYHDLSSLFKAMSELSGVNKDEFKYLRMSSSVKEQIEKYFMEE